MNTKIKLNDKDSLNTKKGIQILFDVKLIEGNILIGAVYKGENNNTKFKIKGIGLESKKFDKDSIRILVELLDNGKIDDFEESSFYISG